MIKLSVLAEDLELEHRVVINLLESEIGRKKLNFTINRVAGYIERKEEEQTYLDVLNRATGIVGNYNKKMVKNFLDKAFENKESNKNALHGYGLDEIDDDTEEGIMGKMNQLGQNMRGYFDSNNKKRAGDVQQGKQQAGTGGANNKRPHRGGKR